MTEVSTGAAFCKSEFHYSKCWFGYHNWKAFTYTPWLPYKWPYQAIYLVYRWCLVIYFLSWLIVSGVASGGPLYFIFLTNWAIITFNIYLVIAALSTTTKFLTVYVICQQRYDEAELDRRQNGDYSVISPSGCCGYTDNKLTWYQMIHWFLFNIGNLLAFSILILYWSLLYRGGPIDGVNANTHLVNGLVAVVDFWVSGVPVNFLHFFWIVIYAMIYGIFTGLYFVISGGDIIYTVLDYENGIGLAVGLVVGVAFIFLPLVHIVFFYLQYLLKFGLLHCYFSRNRGRSQAQQSTESNEADTPFSTSYQDQ